MLTPRRLPCFQRSPRPFQLFRPRVNREGLGSEATHTAEAVGRLPKFCKVCACAGAKRERKGDPRRRGIPTLLAMTAAVLATVIPSLVEWPAPLSAGVATITSSSATAVPITAATAAATQGLVAVTPSGAAGATAVPVAVASSAVVGHLLREGVAPLPPKLVKKITSLEFVEMADLLEAWLLEEIPWRLS